MASTDLPSFLQRKKALRPRGDIIRNEKTAIFAIELTMVQSLVKHL
jgi:hypothetical protein